MSTRASGTDPGSKSAAEIEREVHQSRADIEHTLDAIQQRLSPGQLVDQALGYLRGGRGAEFARNLGNSVAANPMPVALLGIGVAWMMFSSQRSTREDDGRPGYWEEGDLDPVEEHYGFAEEDLGYLGPEADPGESVGAQLGEAGESVKSKMAGLGESARHAAEQARYASSEARDRFGRARAGIADRAQGVGERVRHQGHRAKQGVLRTLDEQPLVLGAIGLAIGAALGAALPPSETEDRLMGEARDKALRHATKAGREQAGKVREAAAAVAAAAREEAGGGGGERSGDEDRETASRRFAAADVGGPSAPTGTAADTPYPADPRAGLDRS